MISSVELFFEDENEEVTNKEEKIMICRLRRSLKDASNPLEVPDNLFVLYFRLSKHAFQYVLSQISSGFQTTQSSAIPPILKLACALRFLGCGSYQNSVGNDFELGFSQPTVSVVLSEVLNLLEARICPVWINADMSTNEKQEARNYFFQRAGLPGIVGCVDGTHIGIIAPAQLQHQYLNRKGFYSLNAMVACDNNGVIRFIDARYPGSTHDSFVWNHSALKDLLERWWINGERSRYLGDSGYPVLPYLIVPFRNASSGSREGLFNKKHAKARNIIERTIGVLKSRFRLVLNERKLH
ncbi:putative nuclease HARBI1 isoform X1 [Eupeodes corollae]|uniref:putative nuclease HARBI1 isoform X1 n=1 Tax=Eupeodes corollae TaxID=290404 RepID=UPI0024935315|nr:putative nuclease HARBI1 isoform X1 [Eupeodes corollae]